MRHRIGTMLLALGIVRPPVERFYESLSDEQKARFNAVGPVPERDRGGRENRRTDLSQICGEQALKSAVAPTDRIAQVLKPTESQRVALASLNDATVKAADYLKTGCPSEEALTPTGRLIAMEQRLNAMLEAIKIIQPALDGFYGSLTDEQKARFNVLGSEQS
jgi:hypothetical protein